MLKYTVVMFAHLLLKGWGDKDDDAERDNA
jgi:hypothetical protein